MILRRLATVLEGWHTMSNAPTGGSKFQIDSDWKAEAEAEKERLEQKVKASEATKPAAASNKPTATGKRELPPASMETLLQSVASQAMLYLGVIPDPRTGQRMQHLDLARHHIDTLAILEEKTKNNLTDPEKKLLLNTLYELRQAYIQVATAIREQRKG